MILKPTLLINEICGLCFLCTFCLSLIVFNFLRPYTRKQWLEYQQCKANHSFEIDVLEDSDIISKIDM